MITLLKMMIEFFIISVEMKSIYVRIVKIHFEDLNLKKEYSIN